MSVGAEALGEVVTGGMAARAVEPEAGGAGHGHDGACLNCGASLGGHYCANCGQTAHVHRSVAAWWHDLVHGVLHFEGKTWRTLPMLAWRPGELTRRYVEGQRARFVSPMALFLFTVFLMFAVMGALSMPLINLGSGDDPATAAAYTEQLADLRRQQEAMRARGEDPASLEPAVRAVEAARVQAAAPPGERRDTLFGGKIDTGWERLDKGLKKANENPALLSYKLQSSAYKYSWVLIPLSLPFLWLLFLHRRRYRAQFKAYDHLIFITYSISFMSMLLILLAVLTASGLPTGLLKLALVLAVPAHIFRHVKGAYGLGAWSALWRTAVLLFFASLTLTLFFLLLLGLGLLA
jgi:hypothetical protein